MLPWKGKHEPGKHTRKGEPMTGNGRQGGDKPSLISVILRWPTGAIQERQTRNMRQGK